MTLEEEIKLAKEFCITCHGGQFRRDGWTPYHTHPFAVADAVPDELKPAALLHDVPEDTGTTYYDLVQAGFSVRTTNAVLHLTKYVGETYDDYIRRVLQNPDAVRIKIADMKHNLSCQPSENSIKKINKWLPILEAAVAK